LNGKKHRAVINLGAKLKNQDTSNHQLQVRDGSLWLAFADGKSIDVSRLGCGRIVQEVIKEVSEWLSSGKREST
jgi:hypothetical protein